MTLGLRSDEVRAGAAPDVSISFPDLFPRVDLGVAGDGFCGTSDADPFLLRKKKYHKCESHMVSY